ncbi:hypothetical protein COSO111634_31810 [Corallococcus soli]
MAFAKAGSTARKRSTEGTAWRTVMRCLDSVSARSALSRCASGGASTSVAPDSSVEKTSAAEASKPGAASWSCRSPAPSANVVPSHVAWFTSARWEISTPLGCPVLPDV